MDKKKKAPKVRLARPKGRKIELRYTDPESKKEIRISTGTLDESEALEQQEKLKAKLLLGIDAKPKNKLAGGPNMEWEDFRDRYRELHLHSLRDRSGQTADNRLDLVERILKPSKLSDIASSEVLHDLQARLVNGEESKTGSRSRITARNYIVAVLAALNWAEYMGWLPAAPRVHKVKVSKLRQMKGRAITGEEFDRMLEKVKEVVGEEAETSWKYLLHGAWESSLRLEELMHVHWSDHHYIVPQWKRGSLAILTIPAEMQKNDTEESIPLLPGFEQLLLETPRAQRFGWCFNPMSLQVKLKRRARHQRPSAEWVGKIISRIGKKAGVIVQAAKGAGKPKYASAHDLRRSCAERLIEHDVPEREVAKILRHADVQTTRRFYAPGTVQTSAGIIRDRLSRT